MVADATEAETDDFATRGTQSRPRSRTPVYGDKTHYTQHHVLVLKNGELVVNIMRNPRAMAGKCSIYLRRNLNRDIFRVITTKGFQEELARFEVDAANY